MCVFILTKFLIFNAVEVSIEAYKINNFYVVLIPDPTCYPTEKNKFHFAKWDENRGFSYVSKEVPHTILKYYHVNIKLGKIFLITEPEPYTMFLEIYDLNNLGKRSDSIKLEIKNVSIEKIEKVKKTVPSLYASNFRCNIINDTIFFYKKRDPWECLKDTSSRIEKIELQIFGHKFHKKLKGKIIFYDPFRDSFGIWNKKLPASKRKEFPDFKILVGQIPGLYNRMFIFDRIMRIYPQIKLWTRITKLKCEEPLTLDKINRGKIKKYLIRFSEGERIGDMNLSRVVYIRNDSLIYPLEKEYKKLLKIAPEWKREIYSFFEKANIRIRNFCFGIQLKEDTVSYLVYGEATRQEVDIRIGLGDEIPYENYKEVITEIARKAAILIEKVMKDKDFLEDIKRTTPIGGRKYFSVGVRSIFTKSKYIKRLPLGEVYIFLVVTLKETSKIRKIKWVIYYLDSRYNLRKIEEIKEVILKR